MFKVHSTSVPCTELSFNYTKVKTVFHLMASLNNALRLKNKQASEKKKKI